MVASCTMETLHKQVLQINHTRMVKYRLLP